MRIEYLHVRRMVQRGHFRVPEVTWVTPPSLRKPWCYTCKEYVDDKDLIDLSEIRFQRVYCRTHFRRALNRSQP